MKTLSLYNLLSLLGVVALLVACTSQAAPDEAPAEAKGIPVTVTTAQRTQQLPTIYTAGRLEADESLSLSFKVGGIVQAVLVREGQYVAAGAVIARLELGEIDAQVQQANAGLDKAERDLKRAEALWADSVGTLQGVQDARTAYQLAQAQQKEASFNRRYALVYAPQAGRVLSVDAEKGELVQPGQPIVQLAGRAQRMVLRATLSDADRMLVQLGDTAQVAFDAMPGRQLQAVVQQLGYQPEAMSGTYEAELTLLGLETSRLPEGLIASVSLQPRVQASTETPLYKLPIEAVTEVAGGRAVLYTVNQGSAEQLSLAIQAIGPDYVLVASKQPLGQVVSRGAAYLQPGSKVVVSTQE